MASNVSRFDHVVLLMLENRSFDHMLGCLYAGQGNRSPLGHPFEGLDGTESNLDSSGKAINVFTITNSTPMAYFMPGVNPGESYIRRNAQLFGSETAPASPPPADQCNIGYVQDFEKRIAAAQGPKIPHIDGTTPADIMGVYTPEMLPILSGLAKGYAVCDNWFASVPSETMPNRAFALAGTSLGEINDPFGKATYPTYNTPSIFGRLADAKLQWRIYGAGEVMTRNNFPDTINDKWCSGSITDFKNAARNGTLPEFSFIEPGWSGPGQSDQHPVSDVSAGEQLIADVYYALFNGKDWNSTLFIITYDECGGCYDHVMPPWGDEIIPPDNKPDPKYAFDFKRLGPRVPAVLVSPLIRAGTVFRVPDGATPLEHTAILKTIETRWNLPSLSARDAAAPDLSAVLTLTTPRTDDPLANVQVPHYSGPNPFATAVTHVQQMTADTLEAHPAVKASGQVKRTRPSNSVDFENYVRTLGKHS